MPSLDDNLVGDMCCHCRTTVCICAQVFGHSGNLSELKGFEMKRRGELKIIKIFQSQARTLVICIRKIAVFW